MDLYNGSNLTEKVCISALTWEIYCSCEGIHRLCWKFSSLSHLTSFSVFPNRNRKGAKTRTVALTRDSVVDAMVHCPDFPLWDSDTHSPAMGVLPAENSQFRISPAVSLEQPVSNDLSVWGYKGPDYLP